MTTSPEFERLIDTIPTGATSPTFDRLLDLLPPESTSPAYEHVLDLIPTRASSPEFEHNVVYRAIVGVQGELPAAGATVGTQNNGSEIEGEF